jgi:microcin C transport system substrate-binding protein
MPKMSVGNSWRFIEFERVKDCWGGNRPVAGGRNNFDVIRNDYYRDRDVAFEGFTAKNYLFREEFTAGVWTSRYHFPAARDERVKGEIVPGDTPSGARGWFINTPRRVQGSAAPQGARLRLRLEWSNKSTIHGFCQGTHSVFQNSDMTDQGKPSADELKLLGPFRGESPGRGVRRLLVPEASDGSGQHLPAFGEPAIATSRGLATARLSTLEVPEIMSQLCSKTNRNGTWR